jgi:hypothetical protein
MLDSVEKFLEEFRVALEWKKAGFTFVDVPSGDAPCIPTVLPALIDGDGKYQILLVPFDNSLVSPDYTYLHLRLWFYWAICQHTGSLVVTAHRAQLGRLAAHFRHYYVLLDSNFSRHFAPENLALNVTPNWMTVKAYPSAQPNFTITVPNRRSLGDESSPDGTLYVSSSPTTRTVGQMMRRFGPTMSLTTQFSPPQRTATRQVALAFARDNGDVSDPDNDPIGSEPDSDDEDRNQLDHAANLWPRSNKGKEHLPPDFSFWQEISVKSYNKRVRVTISQFIGAEWMGYTQLAPHQPDWNEVKAVINDYHNAWDLIRLEELVNKPMAERSMAAAFWALHHAHRTIKGQDSDRVTILFPHPTIELEGWPMSEERRKHLEKIPWVRVIHLQDLMAQPEEPEDFDWTINLLYEGGVRLLPTTLAKVRRAHCTRPINRPTRGGGNCAVRAIPAAPVEFLDGVLPTDAAAAPMESEEDH